ncbi:hypothetical protein CEE44_04545 [Candidatus Woesearchaeota archaeon B3_Woes]|nr:MAG: hypothetical protein CEE44_04545 [Candidatus Woesearchaeota archaeon B3_Woes]
MGKTIGKMNKSKILVISVVFLVMFSFVVISDDEQKPYNEMSRGEQEEFLIELFGEGTTVTPDDVSIDPYTGTVFINTGYAVLTDIGFPVVLNGGTVFVSSSDQEPYTGTIEIQDGGTIWGANGRFNFGKGGSVDVVNGVIQFQNVDLKEGTEFNHPTIEHGHVMIHGERISYDSETGQITSKNLKIFDIEINSEFDNLPFVYDIATNKVTVVDNGWVSIMHRSIVDNEIVNKEMILLDGAVSFGDNYYLNSLTLDGGSVLTMVIKNEEEERDESSQVTIGVSKDTCIGVAAAAPGCVNDGNSIILMESETRTYPYPFTSDLFIDTANDEKEDNKIDIEFWNVGPGPDDINNIFVNEIEGGSRVDMEVVTFERLADGRTESPASSVVRFVFSEDSVISQSDLSGMRTNIMYVDGRWEGEGVPWMIYNGKELTGDEVGATARDVAGDFYDFNGRLSDYLDLMPPPPEFQDIVGDVDVSEVVKEFASNALEMGVVSNHFGEEVHHFGVEVNGEEIGMPRGVIKGSFTDSNGNGQYDQGEKMDIHADYIMGDPNGGGALYRNEFVSVDEGFSYSTEYDVLVNQDGRTGISTFPKASSTMDTPNIIKERILGLLANPDLTRPLTQEELKDMNMGTTIIRNPTP